MYMKNKAVYIIQDWKPLIWLCRMLDISFATSNGRLRLSRSLEEDEMLRKKLNAERYQVKRRRFLEKWLNSTKGVETEVIATFKLREQINQSEEA